MYLPYLRGKQFELLALRSFSQSNPNCTQIIPIIEPVKQNTKALEQTLEVLLDNNLCFSLILNPRDGDFKHPQVEKDIIKLYTSLLTRKGRWIPSYIYHNNGFEISEHYQNNGLDDILIIFPANIDLENSDVASLLSNRRVKYVVIFNGSRSNISKVRRLGKNVISLKDRFITRPKNSDYANSCDEFFSEDFAYYQSDNLWGYSDYTTIGKDFVEGGMLPYAIAIHLTYQRSVDEICVHHFVSESNYNQSNIRGKFIEAARKIQPFYDENNLIHTTAVDELINKSESYDKYPGLGYIKKLSILNHLELINRLSH